MKELLWQVEFLVQVLALGETPTYQMKEHCVQTLNWSRQKGRVSKSMFLRCFCLDHSKLEVVLQNCWISLITDDFENLRKSEWVSYRTPHQQNQSLSWKSSELHMDETSQYPRATGGSRFIFLSKLKLIIPIFKSFKSDCTLKLAYSLKSSSIFNRQLQIILLLCKKLISIHSRKDMDKIELHFSVANDRFKVGFELLIKFHLNFEVCFKGLLGHIVRLLDAPME